jgi:hypothetical protein
MINTYVVIKNAVNRALALHCYIVGMSQIEDKVRLSEMHIGSR